MRDYDPFEETRRQIHDVQKWARARRRLIVMGAAGVALVVGLGGSYYQVEAEEVAVVLRFGRHVETSSPGPHFRIPVIDTVIKVPIARQLRMEFGFRSAEGGRGEGQEVIRNATTAREARMLTADLNVGTVEWIVQYIIDDPVAYVFRFRNVEQTLALMAEATMRQVVGDFTVDELITEGRIEIEAEAHRRMSEVNESYGTGIKIQHVKLKRVDVPDQVKPAFSEVEEAKQERARLINQAEQEYNKVIPKAQGEAAQAIASARGYESERVNRAEGDAGRFEALYQEFRKAKDITRTRMYFEALAEVLPRVKKKVIVDPEMKGLVPLLHLGDGAASSTPSLGPISKGGER